MTNSSVNHLVIQEIFFLWKHYLKSRLQNIFCLQS